MSQPPVYILEKDARAGNQILDQLSPIGIPAQWVTNVADLLAESEARAPVVCLIRLYPPVHHILILIADLIQEPRFARTAFILMGPIQYKHAAFEAGADDYVVTPPDVIELRKRVRLYLDRAMLEARLVAETGITQQMSELSDPNGAGDGDAEGEDPVTLLEHAATLQQERNLFEQILLNAGSGIALVAPDGTLRFANPSWERLFAPLLIDDTPPFGWPPATTDSSTTHALSSAIREEQAWQGDACFVLRNQCQIDLSLALTPACDAKGELGGFVLVLSDISDRKIATQRSAQFISDAAAEMRSPVTNIKMRQYLLREVLPEQRPAHLDALERETDRLVYMVDAILELSRMDAQQIQMQFEPVSLYRLAGEAIIRYGPTANEKGVALVLTGGEHLPTVEIDHARITRAVGALITNAIQHTPETGAITVRIGTATRDGAPYQTLAVHDTGAGLAEADLPLIFDRFYRSDRTRMSGIRGVGLGLSVAQAIVARHGGLLTVHSVIEEGSTFTIWLPVREE